MSAVFYSIFVLSSKTHGLTGMKLLYLVRHAKSSWSNLSLDDFDRPLNKRGKRDAPMMAKRMLSQGIAPSLLLSSPAKRAMKTCKVFAKELDYSKQRIETDMGLYHASSQEILNIIRGKNDALDSIMVFGHNPGFTDLSNALTGENILNVPTCGIVAVNFSVASWSDLAYEEGQLIFFDYPKRLENVV